MILFNEFIGYVDRSLQQAKAAILAKIVSPSGIPEMTDHTDSNPWIKSINVWTGILEQLGFYVDNAVQELFLPFQEEFRSAAYWAESVDYRIKGWLGATVDLRFFISAATTDAIVIPAGTRVKTNGGIFFTTLEEGTIAIGETEVIIPAKNQTTVSGENIGTSDGTAFQIFPLDAKVLDQSVTVDVNAQAWESVETLAYSMGSDLHFVAGINAEGIMVVRTGDNITGSIPINGQDVTASYLTTDGINGNVPANTIVVIDSAVTVPSGVVLQVNNQSAATGGSDQESLVTLKTNIPASIRTLYRAVTRKDYKDVAELTPGVAKAGIFYNGGRTIDIYIAPDGSTTGIASQALIDAAQEFIEERKTITTRIRVRSAGVVKVKITGTLKITKSYSNAAKRTEAQNAISDFLSIPNQEIGGTMGVGDIYEILENIEGAVISTVTLVTTVPYARPIDHDLQLNWTRAIKPTSIETIHWKIIKISSTTYQLLKSGSFIGVFTFGDALSFDELDMNVANGSYVVGNIWEFVTYAYGGEIILDEPSLPVSDPSDIDIVVTGGL